MRYLSLFLISFILNAPLKAQDKKPEKVDVALVLSVDISYSMDLDEQRLQREGYYEALLSPEIQAAIARGVYGKIAVSYLEWAGARETYVLMDWTIIDGKASAEAFVKELMSKPPRRARRTSISTGIEKGLEMLEKIPYFAEKLVIDISGDGTNNDGTIVERARDSAVRRGVTINGLPVMVKAPNTSWMDIHNLDEYYHDCVIGGPGAFVIPIKSKEEFATATKRKMIMEISSYTPETHYGEIVTRVDRPKVDCLIGERLRRERWGDRP